MREPCGAVFLSDGRVWILVRPYRWKAEGEPKIEAMLNERYRLQRIGPAGIHESVEALLQRVKEDVESSLPSVTARIEVYDALELHH